MWVINILENAGKMESNKRRFRKKNAMQGTGVGQGLGWLAWNLMLYRNQCMEELWIWELGPQQGQMHWQQ